jgi:hypothetical protein
MEQSLALPVRLLSNSSGEYPMMIANREAVTSAVPVTDADSERWWWDEVGVLVEHEVWHLPRLADEQEGAE